MAHTCDPRTQGLSQAGGHGFEGDLELGPNFQLAEAMKSGPVS